MEIKIVNRYDNSKVIICGKYKSIKDCLEKNKNTVCFDDASLDGASLNDASLNDASLNGASLDGASLDGASLNRASLNRASLNGASFDGASLDGASLNRASLNRASLNRASLNRASFYHNINLGKLSDNLTLELMRWDATICGEKLMTEWAENGDCPFSKNKLYPRLFWFQENKGLWKPGDPKLTLRQVYEAILDELKIKRL